ncbi:unnamed protein product, partial [Mesorhabditis belari]|uniref:EF-hand domain-containing protein n=1 Tax=Mesorhabditis belari TaxID=2138241 RepID=A0AAF3FRW4_9BILA
MICLRLGSCSESQQESVHPFIDQLYQDFRQHFQPKWNGKRAQFVEQHLGLQTWHCNSKRSTIIKMGKGLSDDVERYLVENQVAELYARIATDRLRGDHLNEMPIGLRKLREHIRSEIYSNCSLNMSFGFPESTICALREMCESFDVDRIGYISSIQLMQAMNGVTGMQLSKHQIDGMLDETNTNGEGQVNYEVFLKMR